ncbi:MAG TPA: serine/threonine-protein kinase [Streptosporangiaceae bacterium]|jgi:hypothetical protein
MGIPGQPDRVLAGRYRLITPLGSGGMGTVWLAEDEVLDRQVAVKEISPLPGVTGDEQALLRERTFREARIAARLRHPNVVTVYDVVEDGDRPWIVMELGPRRSLSDVVEQDGPLAPRQAAQIGLQVLSALRAAHAIGVIHRDVKPGNVLIDADGRALLTDFGIARAQESSTLTTSGVVVGSPSYIAPERARGGRGSFESDLWALGATLYAAAEGRPPYDRPGALATLMAVAAEEPDPPRHCGPLWPVISGLLRQDPEQRPDAAAVDQMLREIAEADGDGQAASIGVLAPAAVPAGADPGPDSGRGSGERLERAEHTLAFRPLGPEATGPGPLAPEGTESRPQTDAVPSLQHAGPAGPLDGLVPAAAAGPPARPDRGRRQAFPGPLSWVLTALAAIGVVVAGLLLGPRLVGRAVTHPPGSAAEPGRGRGSSAAASHRATRPRPDRDVTTPASDRSAAATPTATPTAAPSATAPAAAPSGAGQPAGAPAGFHVYADPTGFSIAIPDGWNVSHQGGYVYIRDPAGGRFLLIDQSTHPKPDPLADWRQQEANRMGTYPDYHRIRLESVSYPQAEKAADWEFTYTGQGGPVHVLNRNVLANPGHAYALYWSTPASQWSASFPIFQVLARTFRPAPA